MATMTPIELLQAMWRESDAAAARMPSVSTLRAPGPVETRGPDYREPAPHYSRAEREFRHATAAEYRRGRL